MIKIQHLFTCYINVYRCQKRKIVQEAVSKKKKVTVPSPSQQCFHFVALAVLSYLLNLGIVLFLAL